MPDHSVGLTARSKASISDGNSGEPTAWRKARRVPVYLPVPLGAIRLFVFDVFFLRLRHEPLQDFGEFRGHAHLRVGRNEPLARCVRVVRIAL
jgi:hypothetical protein